MMKISSHVSWYRIVAVVLTASSSLVPSARAQLPDSLVPQATHAVECGACSAGQRVGLSPIVLPAVLPDTNRRKAIEYSSLYSTSMTIHRIASYLEIPLFVAEYAIGTQLYNESGTSGSEESSLSDTHATIAGALGVLFITNTVTGVYGLYESRHDPAGRTRKWIHTISMLIADAGFVATAAAADDEGGSSSSRSTHRSLAIGSMGIALASTIMMWFWKN